MSDMPAAWGIRPGASGTWAEEVDAEEERNGPLRQEAFPSLNEAAKSEKKPSKKAKPVKMGLGSFMATSVGRSAQSDKEILAHLPKGSSGLPKEEREPGALGGAFKDYGGDRQGFRGRREDREEREPSRADAANDWGAERKFTPSEARSGGGGGFGGYRDREGGFGGERRGGFEERPRREDRPVSEADTADDWGANRKFVPTGDSDRSRNFGSGFGRDRDGPRDGPRDRDGPREGGFRERHRGVDGVEPSRSDTGDWGARRAPPAAESAGPSGRDRRGYGFGDQPVSQADAEDRWSHRAQHAEPSGSAPAAAEQPAERPRLKLAPRTIPLEGGQQSPAANGVSGASPRSDTGSVGGQQQQQQQQSKKSNPFGAARPREEVLKEKGIDYQKEQLKLEHGEVLREPTPEETEMQAEVEQLQVKLEGLKELTPGETDTISELQAELDEREKALYKLQAELDDKVRFSKSRGPERERSIDSASGRAAAAAVTADDESGFEVVRNPRRDRPAAPAEGQEGRPEGDKLGGRDGSGSWGGGRGSGGFNSREERGPRSGGPHRGDGGGGTRDSREGRDNRRPGGGGAAGGGGGGGW
eukprot:gene5461-5695_t